MAPIAKVSVQALIKGQLVEPRWIAVPLSAPEYRWSRLRRGTPVELSTKFTVLASVSIVVRGKGNWDLNPELRRRRTTFRTLDARPPGLASPTVVMRGNGLL